MRMAVIGHVEWGLFARSREPLERGAIVHLYDAYEEPGGAGGVMARALPALGAEAVFFTALGSDAAAERTLEVLEADGCEVRAARFTGTQNRVTTVVDPSHDRTILVHGPNTFPTTDDPLGWEDLAACDACFHTGDDPRTLVAGRAARVLGATARRLRFVVESGVELDVLCGSASDPNEAYDLADLRVRPRLCTWSEGAAGGRFVDADGTEGRWQAVAASGPVVDTYGAGDHFMVALTLALGRGERRDDALAYAARCAADQLTRRGAAPR